MRKQQCPTRKGTALRRLLALGLLAAAVCLGGVYRFTPEQALTRLCGQYGLGELELVGELGEERPDWLGQGPLYVLQNESHLILAGAEFSLFQGGWSASRRIDLARGTLAPAVFSPLTAYLGGDPQPRQACVLVQIDHPQAAAVELEKTGQSSGAVVRVRVPQEQWQQGPFGPWFFYMFEQPDREFANVRLRVLDGEGAPILWTDDEYGTAEWYSFHWP